MADTSVVPSHLPFPDNIEIIPAALWRRVGLINHLNGPGPSVEAASSGILGKESISWSFSINSHRRPPYSVSLISWRQGGLHSCFRGWAMVALSVLPQASGWPSLVSGRVPGARTGSHPPAPALQESSSVGQTRRRVTSVDLETRQVARGLWKGLVTVWMGCVEGCHLGRVLKDKWQSF